MPMSLIPVVSASRHLTNACYKLMRTTIVILYLNKQFLQSVVNFNHQSCLRARSKLLSLCFKSKWRHEVVEAIRRDQIGLRVQGSAMKCSLNSKRLRSFLGLRLGRLHSRYNGVAAQSSSSAEMPAVLHSDDEKLRKQSAGLYGYDVLKSAKGFRAFAQAAIDRSEDLIARIRELPPSMETIKCMDDISNTVCIVVDAAELCRNTHPDKDYVEEANQASMKLYQFLHYLNTNRELYKAIVDVEQSNVLVTEEARRAAKTLRIDFERGGIHLPSEKMERVNELNLQITRIGRLFNENMMQFSGTVDVFPASSIPESLHNTLQSVFIKNKKEELGLRIPADPGTVSNVLKWVPSSEVRKTVYMAGYSSPKENLAVLDKLIDSRHELAQLLGYGSYAEFAASPTMAGSPEVIQSFLYDLISETRYRANEELQMLERFAKVSYLEPWDEAFYTGKYKAQVQKLEAKVVASYFPLGQCMEGLKVIVKSLFDATFMQVPASPGEIWHRDVEKWELRHRSEGVLGYMFLDLYSRRGKYPSCAHFTLKGGRRASDTEYQLPVVALVCNFSKTGLSAPLLHHWEVENLFHEFGHALHSLLSRTEYQHFSGTRTVIDFAETPSNLFECYAWDYRVLKTFAKDYSTGEVIPEKLVASLNQAKKMVGVTDLLRQVLYAVVDQIYFGPQPLSAGSTSRVLAEMQKLCRNWKHVEGTHWQTRFGHLITYGAGYYSYLYAKCISATIWQTICAKDPLSLETGNVIRRGIFEHGGAKDPAHILRDCLGEGALVTAPTGGVRPCVKQLLTDLGVYEPTPSTVL